MGTSSILPCEIICVEKTPALSFEPQMRLNTFFLPERLKNVKLLAETKTTTICVLQNHHLQIACIVKPQNSYKCVYLYNLLKQTRSDGLQPLR